MMTPPFSMRARPAFTWKLLTWPSAAAPLPLVVGSSEAIVLTRVAGEKNWRRKESERREDDMLEKMYLLLRKGTSQASESLAPGYPRRQRCRKSNVVRHAKGRAAAGAIAGTYTLAGSAAEI